MNFEELMSGRDLKMNKHILMAMDSVANPEKYTVEQLKQNRDDAAVAADAAAAYAAAAYAAAAYVSAVYAYADVAYADCWLDRYCRYSNESKQDYIDEINKGGNSMINILTIECEGVAGISARNDAAGQAFTKVTLENVPMFELITAVIAQSSVEELLSHVTAHDLEIYARSITDE